MAKVEDEADSTKLRKHYFEEYIESEAPCLHGTSGAQLRHKRKRHPRIESDSAGYKVLRQKVKQLKKTGSHGEIYNLLRKRSLTSRTTMRSSTSISSSWRYSLWTRGSKSSLSHRSMSR